MNKQHVLPMVELVLWHQLNFYFRAVFKPRRCWENTSADGWSGWKCLLGGSFGQIRTLNPNPPLTAHNKKQVRPSVISALNTLRYNTSVMCEGSGFMMTDRLIGIHLPDSAEQMLWKEARMTATGLGRSVDFYFLFTAGTQRFCRSVCLSTNMPMDADVRAGTSLHNLIIFSFQKVTFSLSSSQKSSFSFQVPNYGRVCRTNPFHLNSCSFLENL